MVDLKKMLEKTNFLEVVVKTNQKKNELCFSLTDEKLVVFVKDKPENNKANEEIERFLTKKSGKIAKIIRGKKSNKKIIKFS